MIVGSIGGAYFIGWALFSLVVPGLAYSIGRKPVMIASFFGSSGAIGLMLLLSDTYLLILLSFIVGLSAPGRISISFCYLCEVMPQKKRVIFTVTNTLIN